MFYINQQLADVLCEFSVEILLTRTSRSRYRDLCRASSRIRFARLGLNTPQEQKRVI